MQIQISWLLQKPTDLDLHYLQRQGISGFSRTRVITEEYILLHIKDLKAYIVLDFAAALFDLDLNYPRILRRHFCHDMVGKYNIAIFKIWFVIL